jgi:hypothetical protein
MVVFHAARIQVFLNPAIAFRAIVPLVRREERMRSGLAEASRASSRKVVAGFREEAMRSGMARAKAAEAAAGA